MFEIYLWKFYEHDKFDKLSILYIFNAFSSEFNEFTNKSIIPIFIRFYKYRGFNDIHDITFNACFYLFYFLFHTLKNYQEFNYYIPNALYFNPYTPSIFNISTPIYSFQPIYHERPHSHSYMLYMWYPINLNHIHLYQTYSNIIFNIHHYTDLLHITLSSINFTVLSL